MQRIYQGYEGCARSMQGSTYDGLGWFWLVDDSYAWSPDLVYAEPHKAQKIIVLLLRVLQVS